MKTPLALTTLVLAVNCFAAGTNYFDNVSATHQGDGSALTGLNASSISSGTLTTTTPTVYGYLDNQTNSWTTNTALPLGFTNLVLTSAANASCGVTGIANGPTSTERYAQLQIIATGNITFTNPASIHASDYVQTRVVTNGNTCTILFDVLPGKSTNMFISQCL